MSLSIVFINKDSFQEKKLQEKMKKAQEILKSLKSLKPFSDRQFDGLKIKESTFTYYWIQFDLVSL